VNRVKGKERNGKNKMQDHAILVVAAYNKLVEPHGQ